MSRRRPPMDDEPPSGTFKYIMAGGIVVAALLMVVATRRDPIPPPTTTGPAAATAPARQPVVRPVAPPPPHLEAIKKQTALFAGHTESTVGRDALFARAKLYAEHKDYRNASEDLRRLLFRRDVTDAMRKDVEALLRTVELERRKTAR